ncbi:MICOS complex subunit Mic60 isoform X2 [Hyalella azteca]|uniref:MICOS complex subunit MIC60 n=1 Tax=Hyalella azteca TaxID=294128 RepID=A0A8B7NDR3_HYAAZ|nr:MICOS complex subunit Mic60 isoform X2 [Hyalella azteca]
MLHLSKRVLAKTQLSALQNVRHQSQHGAARKSGGGGVAAAVIGGTVIGGFGGMLGYASWSDENRKTIDDNIPGMQYITDAVLGSKAPAAAGKPQPKMLVIPPPTIVQPVPPQVKPAPPQDKPEDQTQSPIMKKKIEREKKKEQEATENVKEKSEDLASALAASMKEANSGVTAALDAAEKAAAVVQQQAMAIILSVDSGAIEDSVKASVSAAVIAAEEAFRQAQVKVTELATNIASSKSSGKSDASVIDVAEQSISELAPAVVKVKEVVNNAVNTMLNVELMCNALKEARIKLAAEVRDVLPTLTDIDAEKQIQLLLGHAYNRILNLQKQIADKQKVLDEIRSRGSLSDGPGNISEAVLQSELDKLRHQLQLQHRSDLGRQQEELEAEVRGQLKRQAAAHSEHLSDMLEKQEHEITAAWQLKLYDEINKEKDRHFRDVASIRAKLLGMQAAVTARADADRAAHAARSLWLACQALRNTIRLGKEGASSFDDQLQPLQSHLTAISVSAGSDEFVQTVIGSISKEAVERGVCTEEALRHRFDRVYAVARRVALVPENGGSLLRYLLSYLQSVLLIQASASAASDTELLDQPINVHDLNTFDILDKAKVCLASDDMLGCVRWLNQLTGESRRVAQDWKEEARRTLETRQAADALMAHAAATTATAL